MSMGPQAPLDHLPTAELFRRHARARANGNRALAFRIQSLLAHRMRSRIAASIRRLTTSSEVDDLVSDVVEAAGKTMFRGDGLGAFLPWLRGIARNKRCSHYRRRACRPRTCALDPADAEFLDVVCTPPAQDPAEVVALNLDVEAALADLRPDHRQVVELLVIEGYSADEVAAQVDGITATNAYKIASRFRQDFGRAQDVA